MRSFDYLSFVLTSLPAVVGVSVYNRLPEQMASHWNFTGQVDGYIPKICGVFLLPLISLAIYLLIKFFTAADPKKLQKNYPVPQIEKIIIGTLIFLAYMYFLQLAWNLGTSFPMASVVMLGLAPLFYLIGTIMPQLEPNWVAGIRTPWTLSNPAVWKKTHKFGGQIFKLSAIAMLIIMFWPAAALPIFLLIVLSASLVTTIYSYYLYSQEEEK